MNLHARYFETIYALMDEISPQYRQRFGERVCFFPHDNKTVSKSHFLF